ncbi:type VI secretion system protein TssL, short form [Pectobacterium sp. B1J-3]|uniref:type VI secretion system protein TssL, short form n=1 Tax=Pectobacterium sp. B1J-3 TaxID=3385371 RepID=UPI003905F00B
MKTIFSIDAVLRDSFLTVVQLLNGAVVEQGDALYQRCQQQVEDTRKKLTVAQLSNESIEHIVYAQCALLDETVLGRRGINGELDDGYDVWVKTPLQTHFFNTLQAGERLYERMRQVLNEPAPDIAVLTCFHRVLLLGFQGRYLNQPQHSRDQLIAALSERVAPFDVQTEGSLLLTGGRRAKNWSLVSSPWFWCGASILIVIALWWGLNHQLEASLAELFSVKQG